MPQNPIPAKGNTTQPNLFEMPLSEVHPKERERVEQLIAANKSAQALDVAKDIHKRRHSAASEALLVDAYGARLEALLERKLDREAMALMDLVRERYPSSRERVREWNAALAARHGDLSALLEPLGDASLPAEKQAAIAARVRRDVVDLRALAESPALAPDHPWRSAAGALYRALEAVTNGPVDEKALALPEVSRSSPLAPWKMLVRAIAAWYRHDDAMCEKCLEAVDADSAAVRLAPPLRSMMHQPQTLTPGGAALMNRAGGNLDSLRVILKRLDSVLERRNHPLILQEISKAVAACAQAEPDLVERLKQLIAVRGAAAGLRMEKIAAAMGGPALANASFWRLEARAREEDKGKSMSIANACAAWEEFRKHAVREGWFPAQGPEAAGLFLHMVDLLRHLDPEDLNDFRNAFARRFDGHADFYRGQPAEIRALQPDRRNSNLYFLDSLALLDRACEADPCAENFQRWLRHAGEVAPATCDMVAERWSAALPNDIPPLLRLMHSAEKRNALQKAFKFMERAEQIDGVNAEVRRARLRLLVSMAVRHLREKKPKLAEKELRQIEALPQAQQGDRPAFVAALRFVWCLLRNEKQAADAAYAEAVTLLGDGPAAQFLFLETERWCGRQSSALGKPGRPTTPLWVAFGRVCALGDDMGMPVEMIAGMAEPIMKELSAQNVPSNPRALSALGEVALRNDDLPLAYAIAGAGLAQGAETQAQFLFLRARCMPPWEPERGSGCLAAASELARRQHDYDLLARIGEWRDQELSWLDVSGQAKAAPDTAEIARVVEREVKERKIPKPRSAPRRVPRGAPWDEEECQCPECRAERAELPPELMELVDRLGPEAVARALADMIGIGGKKKRGRQRLPLDESDLPF
jgi:hypothetical protein